MPNGEWIDAGPILSICEAIARRLSDKRAAALPAVSTRASDPTRASSSYIGQWTSPKRRKQSVTNRPLLFLPCGLDISSILVVWTT